MLRHVILKLWKIKDKEKILEEARGKNHLTYRGKRIKLIEHFFSEIMQTRGEWNKIYNMLKNKQINLDFGIQKNILQK